MSYCSTNGFRIYLSKKVIYRSLINFAGPAIYDKTPKTIVLSGPSGFLGSRVLDSILQFHEIRMGNNLPPGEVVLLSYSPGRLMERLSRKYGIQKMKTIRASRVDYYTQHEKDVWRDHLGSLGLEGPNTVFVNLAALAGPIVGNPHAMMDVNYKAPIAAAKACAELGFGHWIQSSTQAVHAERAGQVPYSRGKAMSDFALSTMEGLPVTIACLGLLYCKNDKVIGQKGENLNLVDLALLPLTPILGDGQAPLQPQEISDAAIRIAYLALMNPMDRPITSHKVCKMTHANMRSSSFRYYDAVGPETLTMLELLSRFASYNGKQHFRPVFIGYRNMEKLLNISSLGNLNRQFVSLLRSEQDAAAPAIGDPTDWSRILGQDAKLTTLDESFLIMKDGQKQILSPKKRRKFPIRYTLRWIWRNPSVIYHGIAIFMESFRSYFFLQPPIIKKK